ncbi:MULTISPECIES: hypothetical protein [Citrobacter]|uniref:Uncharacterized protein n=1 Tax=Citrobacter cronae TaxID=1748967 RepID=A0A7X1BSU0_9ENTR|nr:MULTISPECIES: hypothetical protein [Citrobacter]MBC2621967.1 hypothetical protein [Citrobacter cronae]MDM3300865.1 hypothetical protein [Citrobacter sp. Cc227]
MKHLNLNLFLSLLLFAGNSIASTNCKADNSYYSYNPSQEPVPKEATSKGRVYFYSLPNSDCKTSIFIINNDKVLKYRENKEYSFVNFVNKNGAVVDGWVKNEEIAPGDEQNNELTYDDFAWTENGQKTVLLGKATPELNKWAKESGIKLPDPDNHGFNNGFESWTLTIKNEIVTISQANEIIAKRLGFDDTYVSAITFIDNKYKTTRGIKVGDSWNMVTSKYGMSSHKDTEDGCRFYQYFDMKLSFCLDSSNIVQSISFENYPKKP